MLFGNHDDLVNTNRRAVGTTVNSQDLKGTDARPSFYAMPDSNLHMMETIFELAAAKAAINDVMEGVHDRYPFSHQAFGVDDGPKLR